MGMAGLLMAGAVRKRRQAPVLSCKGFQAEIRSGMPSPRCRRKPPLKCPWQNGASAALRMLALRCQALDRNRFSSANPWSQQRQSQNIRLSWMRGSFRALGLMPQSVPQRFVDDVTKMTLPDESVDIVVDKAWERRTQVLRHVKQDNLVDPLRGFLHELSTHFRWVDVVRRLASTGAVFPTLLYYIYIYNYHTLRCVSEVHSLAFEACRSIPRFFPDALFSLFQGTLDAVLIQSEPFVSAARHG